MEIPIDKPFYKPPPRANQVFRVLWLADSSAKLHKPKTGKNKKTPKFPAEAKNKYCYWHTNVVSIAGATLIDLLRELQTADKLGGGHFPLHMQYDAVAISRVYLA